MIESAVAVADTEIAVVATESRPRSRKRVGPRVHAIGIAAMLTLVVALVMIPAELVGFTVVVGDSMEPTLSSGDLVVTRPQSQYSLGDVVVFRVPQGEAGEGAQVIHRISSVSAAGYQTTGDNRAGSDLWTLTEMDIIGSQRSAVPWIGFGLFVLTSPLFFGLILAVGAFRFTLSVLSGATAGHASRRRDETNVMIEAEAGSV